jgi:hypothetical protein
VGNLINPTIDIVDNDEDGIFDLKQ